MKRLIRVLPFVLCLCLIVSVFAVPAYADSSDVDPADYVTGITVVDGVKSVNYAFPDIDWYVNFWDNSTGGPRELDGARWLVGDDAKQFALTYYPLGRQAQEGWPIDSGRIVVADIIPGSPIDISFDIGLVYYYNQFVDVVVDALYYPIYTAGFYTYDVNGNYLDTVELAVEFDAVEYDGSAVQGFTYSVSGSVPINAYAVLPWFKLNTWLGDVQHPTLYVGLTPGTLKMSTAVDSIVEQSHQMTVIQNKLDDIGGKLDNISGALNGDANVDAGVSDFSGANDTLSNAMQSAGVVMDAGSDSVSDIANSSVMAGTLSSLGSGLAVAFSDEFKVNLCGMSFNPFTLWVTVIGGFSLIALMVAYIFRKRGGS